MSTGYFLIDNPPRRSQGRRVRRSRPTGCIVLHTAENATDITGPDTGAEAVARFIQRRTTPGNYHRIGDRDSIIKMCPFSWEVWQDGTGSNPWAIGISLAMEAATWPRLSDRHRDQYIATMVDMAVEAARWLKSSFGIVVPAYRLTRDQSNRGMPGFIAHGDRDPARRTDPGRHFPWQQFLTEYAKAMELDDDMKPYQIDAVTTIQEALDAAGYNLGPTGVDGDPGPRTAAAVLEALNDLDTAKDTIADVRDLVTPGQ